MHKKCIKLFIGIFIIVMLLGCSASLLREQFTGVPDGILLSDKEVASAMPSLKEKSFYQVLDEEGRPTTGIWKSDIIDKNGLTTFLIILNGNATVSDFVKREEFVEREYDIKILVREDIAQSGFYPSGYFASMKVRALLKGKSLQGEVLHTNSAIEPLKDEAVIQKELPKIIKLQRRKRR